MTRRAKILGVGAVVVVGLGVGVPLLATSPGAPTPSPACAQAVKVQNYFAQHVVAAGYNPNVLTPVNLQDSIAGEQLARQMVAACGVNTHGLRYYNMITQRWVSNP